MNITFQVSDIRLRVKLTNCIGMAQKVSVTVRTVGITFFKLPPASKSVKSLTRLKCRKSNAPASLIQKYCESHVNFCVTLQIIFEVECP